MREPTIHKPLVSIIVITYNSSDYVLETLESCKDQTYKNIELIISDDASTDNTVDLCKQWIKTNQSRFIRTKLIVADVNEGIAPNCNRGLFEAKGVWIKYIAGDDTLLKTCIDTNIELSKSNDAAFIFSQVELMKSNRRLEDLFKLGVKISKRDGALYKKLLDCNILATPTSFIKRNILIKIGGFDERFPMYEDYPMWIKCLKRGYSFYVSDKKTVVYRNNYDTLSNGPNAKKLKKFFYSNVKFEYSKRRFYQLILIKENLKNMKLIRAFKLFINVLQFKVAIYFDNKKNLLSLLIFNSLKLFKPYMFSSLFKKNKDRI